MRKKVFVVFCDMVQIADFQLFRFVFNEEHDSLNALDFTPELAELIEVHLVTNLSSGHICHKSTSLFSVPLYHIQEVLKHVL